MFAGTFLYRRTGTRGVDVVALAVPTTTSHLNLLAKVVMTFLVNAHNKKLTKKPEENKNVPAFRLMAVRKGRYYCRLPVHSCLGFTRPRA